MMAECDPDGHKYGNENDDYSDDMRMPLVMVTVMMWKIAIIVIIVSLLIGNLHKEVM